MGADAYAWTLAAIAALGAMLWRYLRRRVIGDVEMLLGGFVVYIAGPYIVYAAKGFLEMPGIEVWRELYQAAAAYSVPMLVFTAVLALAYTAGRTLCRSRVGAALDRPIPRRTLFVLSLGVWAFWLWLVASKPSLFFAGYSVDYDVELLGQLGTINLMVVIFLLNCRQFGRKGLLYRLLALLFVANSVALLSLGGRMYVLTAVLALLLQALARRPSLDFRLKTIAGMAVLLAALVAVGVWRIGAEQEASFFAYIAAAEGVFTSMSLGSFLGYNGMPAVAFPYNFLGSVVNFVPSLLLGDKTKIVPSIVDAGFYFEAPLGATHLYVALLGNFGWVLAPLFAVALGWLMAAVRRVRRGGWWLYFYLCALLPFMFFRDGFSIFNKAAVFNGVIVVAVVFFLDRLGWGRFRIRPRRPLRQAGA